MLKRAGISLIVALIAALWAFTGFFPVTGAFGQAVFLVASGVFVLSLLFSLFEEKASAGAGLTEAGAALSSTWSDRRGSCSGRNHGG